MIKAFPGLSSNVSVNGSGTLALSFFNSDGSDMLLSNTAQPFSFSIPLDLASVPAFLLMNKSNESQSIATNNLLTLDGFILNKNNVSIHYHIKPSDLTKGYFAAIRYSGNPYLMESDQLFDLWNIFCPELSTTLFFYSKISFIFI